ncbi:MAG TPA: TadE family protein [Pirellulales bacterium]|nr:TadE family protein [Pirellulales bacterium]
MPTRKSSRRRRGATVVEMAFVAPVFFLLVLGMIEFGRAMMVAALLANAAQQGARAGALDGAQTSDVTNAVNNYLSDAMISGASTSVTPSPPSSAGAGQDVTVTVSIGYSQVTWVPAPRYLGGTTLSATSIMQRETGQ